MTTAAEELELGGEDEFEPRGHWTYARHRFVHNRLAMASLIALVGLFGAGLLAHSLAPYPPHQLNLQALSKAPSFSHPFGTDQYGLDYFSRVLYGIGRAARVAFIAGALGTLIGLSIGVVAGYYRGWLDNILMRLTEALVAVPALALVLAADRYYQANSASSFGLLLALVLWPPLARIVRATSLSLREKEYVDAARALGAGDLTILRRHLLPNLIGPIAVSIALLLSAAVLVEPSVAFLLHGPVVNTQSTSLGDVLGGAQDAGPYQWWGEAFPGLTIVVIVVCLNFIGEGVRDALDPAPRRLVMAPSRRRRTGVSRALIAAGEAAAPIVRKPVVAANRIAAVPLDWISIPANRWRRLGRRLRLITEAFVLVVAVTVAAGAIYAETVHHIRSAWPAAGSAVQDVSRADGVQSEVSLAVDPANPRILVAGSNDGLAPEGERGSGIEQTLVYSSTDGGRRWSRSSGPSRSTVACGPGDPALAVDGGGRQYYAFLRSSVCGDDSDASLFVAVRKPAGAPWRLVQVAAPSYKFGFDDKPAIAADDRGRIYVVWSRLLSDRYETFVLSHSDDHGRTWARPIVVDRALRHPILPSITIAPGGDVYTAGVDALHGVFVERLGGRVQTVAQLVGNPAATCATVQSGRPIPGQAYRCIGANPTISTRRGRVFVTYGKDGRVFASVFTRSLKRVLSGEVAPTPKKRGQQFWPVSAVDRATGDLWVCFYDTSGESSLDRAWFTCTLSHDGHRWASPVRVARTPASVDALWSDAGLSGFDDLVHYGGYVGLAVAHGVGHPMWIDTGGNLEEEIYSATLEARAFHQPAAASK